MNTDEVQPSPGGRRRAPYPTAPLWFGLVFAIVGLVALALGVVLWRQESALAERGITTSALVVDRSVSSDSDGTTYFIRYEFHVGGRTYSCCSMNVDRSVYLAARVGETITITYLPDDPSISRPGTPEAARTPAPLIVGGIGALFAAAGIGLTIDALRRRRSGERLAPGPFEAAPGVYRFHRGAMRILVDLVFAPIGAVAFYGMALVVAISVPVVGLAIAILPAFFGTIMAAGALVTVRRGLGRTVFEVGPGGAWSPDMGRLRWDEIAEVRLESMRGPSGGDTPSTTRYLRLGIVPRDPSRTGGRAARLSGLLSRGFYALISRIAPEARLSPTDLAPFGVTDYEIEESIDDVVDAARRYTTVIDVETRRARERAPMWSARAAGAGTATPPIVEADVRALDATLAPGVSRPAPGGADAAVGPEPAPRATFRRPVTSTLGKAFSVWQSAVFLVVPVLFFAFTAYGLATGMPIWFAAIFLAMPAVFFVLGIRQLRATLKRLRRDAGPADVLSIGPEGIELSEMGLVAWDRVAEIRTERAGFTAFGGPSVERWRLVVEPGAGYGGGASYAVESDELDARLDDVLDLVRYYHPVVETG